MSHIVHAKRSCELLQFDLLQMEPGENDHTYSLILKDDCSIYFWFLLAKSCSAIVTHEALLNWLTTVNIVSNWNSDQGSPS